MALHPAGVLAEAAEIRLAQRNQANPNVGVGMPVQVPGEPDNMAPTVAVPRITGATVLAGACATIEVLADHAAVLPVESVAVTRTATKVPASAATNVYFADAAPEITVVQTVDAVAAVAWLAQRLH